MYTTVQVHVTKPNGAKSFQPLTVAKRHKRDGRVRSYTLVAGIAPHRPRHRVSV